MKSNWSAAAAAAAEEEEEEEEDDDDDDGDLGASTSWNSQALSRPVLGLLYLSPFTFILLPHQHV